MRSRVVRLMAPAVVLAAVGSVLAGCNTTGCSDNRSSIPLAGFYSASSRSAIALDSLEIGGIGAPGDSLLLAAGEQATDVYLPLRANRDEVIYEIRYAWRELAEAGVSDQIIFNYQTIPYFASEECGAMYRYRITKVEYSRNILDSVAVTAPDSVITNLNVETLQLFFRTADQ